MTCKVYAVGIGPGSMELLTPQAEKVLRAAGVQRLTEIRGGEQHEAV